MSPNAIRKLSFLAASVLPLAINAIASAGISNDPRRDMFSRNTPARRSIAAKSSAVDATPVNCMRLLVDFKSTSFINLNKFSTRLLAGIPFSLFPTNLSTRSVTTLLLNCSLEAVLPNVTTLLGSITLRPSTPPLPIIVSPKPYTVDPLANLVPAPIVNASGSANSCTKSNAPEITLNMSL